MSQSAPAHLCCVNPDCPQPIQTWGSRFCQRCGSPLVLHNRYLPLQKLGTGGFAVTYVVQDLKLRSERVLKVLVETSAKATALFEQEAQVLASLNHAGVPRVEPDSFFRVLVGNPPTRSLPCLVMEKINGQTLEELLEQHPQGCPEAWVVDWFQQAIEILDVLHQRQIIHRDLKPANLMLRHGSGQLVLIDFGGAKQMRPLLPSAQPSSTRLVSPGYSPPEQITGGSIQPASDFYALGRTLIHLLTGRYPAQLEDPISGALRWRNYAPVNPALADLLDDLVQPDAARRPATAAAIQAQLAPIAAGLPRTARASRQPSSGQQAIAAFERALHNTQHEIFRLVMALVQGVFWAIKATADTAWSTTLAAIGGGIGSAAGFTLAYQTSIGTLIAARLSQELAQVLPFQPQIGADFLLFAIAGLGTAWGLILAGGYGQRRRFWIGGMMGMLGYLFGWLGLQVTQVDGVVVSLSVFAAVAPAVLTVGLGLARHPVLHALIVAIGVAPFIAVAALLSPGFITGLWQVITDTTPAIDGFAFWACLCFFSLLGAALGCCLGISHYLFAPLLRLLGW